MLQVGKLYELFDSTPRHYLGSNIPSIRIVYNSDRAIINMKDTLYLISRGDREVRVLAESQAGTISDVWSTGEIITDVPKEVLEVCKEAIPRHKLDLDIICSTEV